jgi:predicted dehydrogenase
MPLPFFGDGILFAPFTVLPPGYGDGAKSLNSCQHGDAPLAIRPPERYTLENGETVMSSISLQAPLKTPTIVLFGAGFHGSHAVLPAILSLRDHLHLSGIVEPNPENREQALRRAPDVPVYPTTDALFAAQSPDIAYVATLPHLHTPLTLQALAAGCHVICEKPLAPTLAECETMITAAEKADRTLVTMFENRYKKHYRQVREWILAGRIGRVEAIHFQHFWPGPVTEPRRTNLLNASGALDCGIHYLDLAQYFVGGSDWENIHALGQWFDEPQLENPPHLSILARLQNGTLVTQSESMSYRITYAKRTGDRSGTSTLTVIGTDGIVESVPEGMRLHTADATEEFCPEDRSSHSEEIPWVLDDLLVQIQTGKSRTGFLPTGRDGKIAQRITIEANRQAVVTR